MIAATPEEARQHCLQYPDPIHLLLTDVVMPEMSGRQVAQDLGSLRPTMLTLYMSGYTDERLSQHRVLEAETALLRKPFTPDMLAREVREVLDAGRLFRSG